MASQLSALFMENSRRTKTIQLSLALSGNFPGAAGEPINLANILNPKWLIGVLPGEVPAIAPEVVSVPAGYDAAVVPGSGNTLATAWAITFYTQAGSLVPTGA